VALKFNPSRPACGRQAQKNCGPLLTAAVGLSLGLNFWSSCQPKALAASRAKYFFLLSQRPACGRQAQRRKEIVVRSVWLPEAFAPSLLCVTNYFFFFSAKTCLRKAGAKKLWTTPNRRGRLVSRIKLLKFLPAEGLSVLAASRAKYFFFTLAKTCLR
jgi:hypothetical protein